MINVFEEHGTNKTESPKALVEREHGTKVNRTCLESVLPHVSTTDVRVITQTPPKRTTVRIKDL